MNVGAPEILILILVVLLLFGSTRLPKLARSIGEASREFKKGVSETEKAERAERAEKAAEAEKAAKEAAVLPAEEKVTMTRAELDAMLAEREARARRDPPPAS